MRARELSLRFIINEHSSSIAMLREHGYAVDVVNLEADDGWEMDWLRAHPAARVWINDRLDTRENHGRRIKAAGLQLATFDDHGGGAAWADVHVAALSFGEIDQLKGRRILRGMDYLVLDPALARFRRVRRSGGAMLLTMGGSDTWGVTPRVMDALLQRGLGATVVLGPAFRHHNAVDAVQVRAPAGLFTVHRGGVPSLIAEMANHELAITGGGMTPFQANSIGLPCVVIASESFEIPVGRALERLGSSVFAGHHTEMDLSSLDSGLPLTAMSQAGIDAIDLRGIDRVVTALVELAEG